MVGWPRESVGVTVAAAAAMGARCCIMRYAIPAPMAPATPIPIHSHFDRGPSIRPTGSRVGPRITPALPLAPESISAARSPTPVSGAPVRGASSTSKLGCGAALRAAAGSAGPEAGRAAATSNDGPAVAARVTVVAMEEVAAGGGGDTGCCGGIGCGGGAGGGGVTGSRPAAAGSGWIGCWRASGVRTAAGPEAGTTWTRMAVPAVRAPTFAVIDRLVVPGCVPHRMPHTDALPCSSAMTSSARPPLAKVPVTPLAGSRKVTMAPGMGEPVVSTIRTVAPV